MPDLNTEIQRALLGRAVDRTRFENDLLSRLSDDWQAGELALEYLTSQSALFSGIRPQFGTLINQTELTALLQDMAGVIGSLVQTMVAKTSDDLRALIELELTELPQLLQDHISKLTEAVEPLSSLSVVQSISSTQVAEFLNTPAGGARFATAFADLGTALVLRLRNTLTNAILQGLSTAQAVRQVQGVLGGMAQRAELIVRSEYVRVANQAALATFAQNRDLIRGVQWVSTLDSSTCLQCGVLDGRTWTDMTAVTMPVTHTHPRCRCALVPLLVGLPTPKTQTYKQWFAEQSAALQREILGPVRYQLYKRGRVKLPGFVSARGIRSIQSVLANMKA